MAAVFSGTLSQLGMQLPAFSAEGIFDFMEAISVLTATAQIWDLSLPTIRFIDESGQINISDHAQGAGVSAIECYNELLKIHRVSWKAQHAHHEMHEAYRPYEFGF